MMNLVKFKSHIKKHGLFSRSSSTLIASSIEAAKENFGIVASYKELKIIKKSGLKNILLEIKGETIKEYFIYPKFLEKDQQIIDLRNYLLEKLLNPS